MAIFQYLCSNPGSYCTLNAGTVEKDSIKILFLNCVISNLKFTVISLVKTGAVIPFEEGECLVFTSQYGTYMHIAILYGLVF